MQNHPPGFPPKATLLSLLGSAIFACTVLMAGSARAVPVLTVEAYVVDRGTGTVEASDIQIIPFDMNETFNLPAGFGAYSTGTGSHKVNHVGYSSGTFGGSGSSGQPELAVQGSAKPANFSSANAPGDLYVAITERNIVGNGDGLFAFSDSMTFKKSGSSASYYVYYDVLNRLFPAGVLVDPGLPYTHTAAGSARSFADPQASRSIVIGAPLISFSEGFRIRPVSGGNPLVEGAAGLTIPEPAPLLSLAFGGLTTGLFIWRRKSVRQGLKQPPVP